MISRNLLIYLFFLLILPLGSARAVPLPIITEARMVDNARDGLSGVEVEVQFVDSYSDERVLECRPGHSCQDYDIYVVIKYNCRKSQPCEETSSLNKGKYSVRPWGSDSWNGYRTWFSDKFAPLIHDSDIFYRINVISAKVCISSSRGQPEDGTSCRNVTVSPVKCELSQGNLVFEHGTISERDAPGNITNVNARLTCTGPATIRVKFTSDLIDLGGGVKSKLSVNGVTGGGTLTTPGESDLTFTSQLTVSGNGVGNHSGSGVVVLDVE